MYQTFTVEVSVKGGFPVIVKGVIGGAEPDVGHYGAGIDDYEVFTLKGKSASFLRLTTVEEQLMLEEVWRKLQ